MRQIAYGRQAKTNYTFTGDGIDNITYKLVPYLQIDGKKAYNQAALNSPFGNIPRVVLYGITHTVIENTVEALEIRFDSPKKPPEDFEMILIGGGVQVPLNAGNKFIYRTTSPPAVPDVEIVYSLTVDGHPRDYSFTVRRPTDAEFYAAFERKVLADMNMMIMFGYLK